MAVSPDDKRRALLACCRPDQDDQGDRKLREVLGQMKANPALQESFAAQARFDEQMAALVRDVPLPSTFEEEIAAGLRRTAQARFSWRALLREPLPWAVLLAFAFLVAWGANALYQRVTGFPGDETITHLVETASSDPDNTKLEPLDIECGKLGDTLFLKYGIDDYQVPPTLARLHTVGYRVFDEKDSSVTQVEVREHALTFLIFRADQLGVEIKPAGEWKFISGDGWAAAAEVHNNMCFVAMCHGSEDQLADYLTPSPNTSPATGGTGDILTGMVSGMIAQHPKDIFAAVCAAVHLHGFAGDVIRESVGEHSLIATDLLTGLPEAFRRTLQAAREKTVQW